MAIQKERKRLADRLADVCFRCVYWYLDEGDDPDHGVCYRYPPQVSAVNKDGKRESNWPNTKSIQSCGEFEEAEFELPE